MRTSPGRLAGRRRRTEQVGLARHDYPRSQAGPWRLGWGPAWEEAFQTG